MPNFTGPKEPMGSGSDTPARTGTVAKESTAPAANRHGQPDRLKTGRHEPAKSVVSAGTGACTDEKSPASREDTEKVPL